MPKDDGNIVRLAIAASFTAEPIGGPLEVLFDGLGLHAEIQLAPFGQVFQSLLDPRSLLRTNVGGTNAVLLRATDVAAHPGDSDAALAELARALRAAVAIDPHGKDEVPSTKGSLGG